MAVKERGPHVRELDAICQLAARTADSSDPLYADLTAGIAATSGLHPTSLTQLVAMWADGWQRADLERALRRGLGPEIEGRRPVGRVAIVAPGNLCVATWQAIAEAILVGNHVSVRPGSGDPDAAANFQKALARVDEALAQRLTVREFDRGDRVAWARWLAETDALVVYGGDPAIAAVLRLAGETGYTGRVRLHGHFQSMGVLGVDVLANPSALQAAVEGWAMDTLLADGRGCMSLRALWLVGELDDAGRALLREALAAAFARVAALLPAGRVDPGWQARNQLHIENHAFQSAVGTDRWLERGHDWAILGTHGPMPTGAAALGPGARSLAIHEARDADDLLRQLTPWQRRLSTVSTALGTGRESVLAAIDKLGVHRMCQPGAMQAPSADRAPDGHLPFSALVRFTDKT